MQITTHTQTILLPPLFLLVLVKVLQEPHVLVVGRSRLAEKD